MVLVSAGIYRVLERLLSTDVGARRLDLLFVAIAFNLYYWMAVPGVVAIAIDRRVRNFPVDRLLAVAQLW